MSAADPGPTPGSAPPARALPLRRFVAPSRARQTLTPGQMARRRFAMAAAKRLLPLAAVGLLAAIVLWPEFDRTEDRARVSFRRVLQVKPEAVRVVAPRFQGVDDLNRPYTVTAEVAAQQGDQEVLDLEAPRADILLSDGAWVLLEADGGRYDRARNHLDLDGRVTLWHDNGTTLVTDRAAIEIKAGAASGDAPVAAQGPFGTLTSEGFRLLERGTVVVFTGRARAVLEGGE
jgi:lipopolysaccharide export system protein LptC